jgi:hypothetical protein
VLELLATSLVTSHRNWALVLIPLLAAVLGAMIGSASSIWLERRRDYRVARASAIVLYDTLSDIIAMQNITLSYHSAPNLLPTERFIGTWLEHRAALALSISVDDWRTVSLPFARLDSLLGVTKVREPGSPSIPGIWISTLIPDSIRQARQSMTILSSHFSLPEIRVPESLKEVIEHYSTEDPELSALLQSFVDSLSGPVPDNGATEPGEN